FFQAEDGIRDDLVTGVQTCALPISAVFHVNGSVDPLRDIDAMNLELTISDLSLIETRLNRIGQDQKKKFEQERADEATLLEKLRSEERRVGKGGKSECERTRCNKRK